MTSLNKFAPVAFENGILGRSEYFTVKKMIVNGEASLQTDEKSFACITCVKGQGEIDGQAMQTGDSYFIPANYGPFTLKGDMEIVQTKI